MDVTLAWDENPFVSGYHIYYKTGSSGPPYDGTVAQEGDSPVDMTFLQDENQSDPNVVEFTLHGLSDDENYFFVVTAYDYSLESIGSQETYVVSPNNIPDPYNIDYNRGWGISSGDLKNFLVLFNDSSGAVPTLGTPSAIPALHESLPDVEGVGVTLNLQPSGALFSPPVTIFIPCPGFSDVSGLDIYYYDDNRGNWFLANDADAPDMVEPDAVGWMVPGSRANHNDGGPSALEIQLLHFSGVQAGTLAGGGGEDGGCFISTLTEK